MSKRLLVLALGSAVALGAAAPDRALADPGDTLRVAAERANLRAGPGDTANVRTQLTRGEELLELRQDGNWHGVRVLRTGEEGWIFGDLLSPVTRSTLVPEGGSGGAMALPEAGFQDLSRDFDRLIAAVSQRDGMRLVDKVAQADSNALNVTLSPEWLRSGSANEHILLATAIYQMWKNHQNAAPVRVDLLQPGGEPYIRIDDTESAGNLLSLMTGG